MADDSRQASSAARPPADASAAALSSNAAVPPATPDYAVIFLQRSPSGRNASAERPTPGRVGEKQGRSNLSSVSLSLVVLGCLFCCICVGSIIVRERVRPEEAVTLVTPAGGAVGLEQIQKERRKGSKDGAAGAAEGATADLEAGRQQQHQSAPSASTRTPVTGDTRKEQVAMQRVQDMAARWWSDELTERRKKPQRSGDDDDLQPPTTPKRTTPRNQSEREPHTRVSIAGEAIPAATAAAASAPAQPAAEGEAPKPAAALSAADAPAAAPPAPAVTQPDIPYQPTIILHSTM